MSSETANTTFYSVRIIAALLLLVVFGGLPTVVDGRPLWAAIVGAIGVIVAITMLSFSLRNILKNQAARKAVTSPRD